LQLELLGHTVILFPNKPYSDASAYAADYFPNKPYLDASAYAADYVDAIRIAFSSLDSQQIHSAASCLEQAIKRNATIFVCGNGGSAGISNHFVCDHMKGVRTGTNLRPRVSSLSENIEIVTAIANDIGYENVFDFQLASVSSRGDVLVTISSSGNSPNILNALRWARGNGLTSIAMTGFDGGESRSFADISLHVDAQNYGVVEDVHQSLIHLLAQFLRQKYLLDPSLLGKTKF